MDVTNATNPTPGGQLSGETARLYAVKRLKKKQEEEAAAKSLIPPSKKA